jgi:hypothetical protein
MLRRCVRSWRRACEARIIRIREGLRAAVRCRATSQQVQDPERQTSRSDYQVPRFADSSCLYF